MKRKPKIGDHVMLYAKVTWVSKLGDSIHLETDGGNHISENAKDVYSTARPISEPKSGKGG